MQLLSSTFSLSFTPFEEEKSISVSSSLCLFIPSSRLGSSTKLEFFKHMNLLLQPDLVFFWSLEHDWHSPQRCLQEAHLPYRLDFSSFLCTFLALSLTKLDLQITFFFSSLVSFVPILGLDSSVSGLLFLDVDFLIVLVILSIFNSISLLSSPSLENSFFGIPFLQFMNEIHTCFLRFIIIIIKMNRHCLLTSP